MQSISFASILKVALVVIGLIFLYLTKEILVILFLAVIIASAVSPAVSFLEKYYIPRALGTLFVYVFCFGILIFVFYLITPLFISEIQHLAILLPDYYEEFSKQILKTTRQISPDYTRSAQEFLLNLGGSIKEATSGLFGIVSRLFGGVVAFGAIIVISFYLAVQKKGVEGFLRLITPQAQEEYVLDLWKRVEVKLGRWLQGQLFLGLIVGVTVFIGLTIIGVPYALLLGLVAGIFEILPMVGPVFSAILGVAVAFVVSPVLAFLALIFYVILQQFENHILLPLLMKKITGLNPVVVIIALLAGAKIGGVLGMLIAVPIATIAGELFEDLAKQKAVRKV